MKNMAYIYVFVSKNNDIDVKKRIFFVGSCLVEDIKNTLFLHIKDLFFPVGDHMDKDVYIKKHLGLYKFDIYIYDIVPKSLMRTYHKLYYEILSSENYQLKHTLDIIPEYNEMLKNSDFVRCCYNSLRDFNKRELNKENMTYIEVLINELKSQYIINSDMYLQLNMNSNNYLKYLKFRNKKLKQDNDKLSKLYVEVRDKNALLSSFNNFLKNPSQYDYNKDIM